MKLFAALGWCFFALCMVFFLAGHGSRWHFGRYMMPRTLLSPDGLTHLDGTPLNPVTLALTRAGVEEEVYLLCLSFWLVLMAVVIGRRLHAHRVHMALLDRKLRERLGASPRSTL